MKNTIADKVGVMNIIDAMRLESNSIQDYMNTEQQKKKLMESIEQSYRADGVEVDKLTLEKAVDEWYKERLQIKVEDPGWALKIYMIRDKWFNQAAVALAILIVLITANYFHTALSLSGAREYLNATLVSVKANNGSALVEKIKPLYISEGFDQLDDKYSFVKEVSTRMSRNVAAMNLLESKLENEVESRLAEIDAGDVPDMEIVESLVDEHTNLAKKTKNIIPELKRFTIALELFKASIGHSNIDKLKPLSDKVNKINLMLLAPGMDIDAFEASSDELKKMLSRSERLLPLKTEINDLARRSMTQLKLDSDKSRVNAIANRINIAIEAMKEPSTPDIDSIRESERLSRTEINLVVLPDNTKKTGYERTFDKSGGTSWYIIAVTVDEAGQPIDMNVKSRETGMERMASMFGVRVDRAGWERIKKDKLEDGIVNNNKIGIKPMGILDIQFEPGYSAEYILEW